MNDTEVAWAAGFIDGEGTLSIGKGPPRGKYIQYVPYVWANQSKSLPIEYLQVLFDGRIRHRADGAWQWEVEGERAASVCKLILPYLRVKHVQAELVIAFQETIGNHGPVSPEVLYLRQVIFNEMKKVNGRPKEEYVAITRSLDTVHLHDID